MTEPTRPARVTLVNLSRPDDAPDARMPCLLNPASLDWQVAAEYHAHAPVGFGHEVLQYRHSTSPRLGPLEFRLNAFVTEHGRLASDDIDRFAQFLRALTLPTPAEGRPPRTLLVWPEMMTLQTVVREVQSSFTRFAASGRPLEYVAQVSLIEVVQVRVSQMQRTDAS